MSLIWWASTYKEITANMDDSKKTKIVTIVSILLIPSALILHNLNYYKSLFFYNDTYILLTLYLAIPIAFYFLVKKLLGFSDTVSGLITITLSIFFFFFGTIQDFFLSYRLTYYLSKTYVLLLIFLLPVIYLFLKRPEVKRLLNFLQIIIFCFFLTESALLVFSLDHFNEVPRIKEKVSLVQKKNASDSFNIYHIIFDGYTNSKTLQTEFGFSNPIDSFLTEKGFFIAGNSKSNYNFTPYSLASLLHLQYLDTSDMQLERTYKNYLLGNELFHDNAVFRFFKERDYAVQSFCILEDYKHLDKLGTFVPKTPAFSVRNQTLERIFLNPWLWQKLSGTSEGTLPQNVKNSLHYYIEYNQKALQNVLNNSSAKKAYNFTHFLLPHEPYVYKKTTVDSLTEADVMDHQQGYIMQVQYVNGLIENLVKELQKNKNNIIIIQGDHGFREYDLSKISPLKQLQILNAFYFPDQNYSSLHDSISLVNTYRAVLSQYFKQDLPLLKDEHFTPSK